ncbi:hypothetical protein L227DRAFT_565726 [Lentinus tigrinus ALCF2SS1-6]|uniref:Uncharacterized protein n=1 Tax=Lentinus tigrinus ALCF2SS1-6 TaxID=1328759 RepID=A0A5C2S0W4_9APHY|nr:hypothetical protein L227DRAFT_565726 [Lentinus tigrinus ALCF2SS1-6]
MATQSGWCHQTRVQRELKSIVFERLSELQSETKREDEEPTRYWRWFSEESECGAGNEVRNRLETGEIYSEAGEDDRQVLATITYERTQASVSPLDNAVSVSAAPIVSSRASPNPTSQVIPLSNSVDGSTVSDPPAVKLKQERVLDTRAHSGLNSGGLTLSTSRHDSTGGHYVLCDSPDGLPASTNKSPLLFVDFAAYSRGRSLRSVYKASSESFAAPTTEHSLIGEGAVSSTRENMPDAKHSSSAMGLSHDDTVDWEQLRDSRYFKDGKGATVWYRTSGPYSVCQPPSSLPTSVDELYIHRDERNSRSKCWVVNAEGCWVAVHVGDMQPSSPLRRLIFQRNGDPSWVTRKTYNVYRSRWRRGRAIRRSGRLREGEIRMATGHGIYTRLEYLQIPRLLGTFPRRHDLRSYDMWTKPGPTYAVVCKDAVGEKCGHAHDRTRPAFFVFLPPMITELCRYRYPSSIRTLYIGARQHVVHYALCWINCFLAWQMSNRVGGRLERLLHVSLLAAPIGRSDNVMDDVYERLQTMRWESSGW